MEMKHQRCRDLLGKKKEITTHLVL